MQIDIPYGKELIKVRIPESCQILVPKKLKLPNQNEIIKRALNNPIEKEPLEQFIKKVKKLLIIVNDATRPTPTWKILAHIYPVLSSLQEMKFLIATGNHHHSKQLP